MRHSINVTALLTLGLLSVFSYALTPPELMDEALKSGISKGELTGPMADTIKQATRSQEPLMATLQRLEESGDCQYFSVTMTQANIPLVNGENAGEYMTVTKVGTCRGDAKPNPPVVLECKVGKNSCMGKPKAK